MYPRAWVEEVSMSRIVLEHIDKFYGENHVLKDINLTIEDGDFMTLLGPSGCGKIKDIRLQSWMQISQARQSLRHLE